MSKKKIFIHAAVLGAIVVVLSIAMVFIRMTFVEPATGKTSGYYINDVFDAPDVPFSHGNTVEQDFSAAGNIYGMRVRFHNAAIPQAGSFQLQLVDKSTGEIVAQTTGNTETLLNDNYSAIHFDTPYLTEGWHDYTMRITPDFQNPNAYMRIWSDSEKGDISFGVIDYVADSAVVYSWFKMLWVLVLAVGILLYTVCFIFNLKKEDVFLVALLCVSLLVTIVLPPFSSPDEEGHFETAYQLANRIEGHDLKWTNDLMRRDGDSSEIYEDHYTTVLSYEYIWKNFFRSADSGDEILTHDNWIVLDFDGVYTAGAVGIMISKMLNLGYVAMTYLGRFMNLMVFAVCAYFAVKITPVGKEIFMTASLLPVTLHLANSFSRDVFVISMGFIFTAYLLRLLCQTEKYKWSQILLLMAIAVLLAPSKYIYSLMCPLVLLLKPQNFGIKLKTPTNKKHRIIAVAGLAVMLAAVACFIVFTHKSVFSYYLKGIIGEAESLEYLLANSPETTFNFALLMANPVVTLKMFLNTIYENGAYYIKSVVGGVLGYNSIYISDAFIFVILIMLVLSACSMPKDEYTLQKKERVGFTLAFLLVAAAVVYAALTWTPVYYTTIYGIQGKYLMPALPLFLIACKNRLITITKDIFKPMCFIMAFTNVFVMLNALTVILQR